MPDLPLEVRQELAEAIKNPLSIDRLNEIMTGMAEIQNLFLAGKIDLEERFERQKRLGNINKGKVDLETAEQLAAVYVFMRYPPRDYRDIVKHEKAHYDACVKNGQRAVYRVYFATVGESLGLQPLVVAVSSLDVDESQERAQSKEIFSAPEDLSELDQQVLRGIPGN
jgi:hypothetical protein